MGRMRMCPAWGHLKAEDEWTCLVNGHFPYICPNDCAKRPLLQAIATSAYTESDLRKLSELAQTEDVEIKLVPKKLPRGVNEVRAMLHERETRDETAIENGADERPPVRAATTCAWPGCEEDISFLPGARRKYCEAHRLEAIRENQRRYERKRKGEGCLR